MNKANVNEHPQYPHEDDVVSAAPSWIKIDPEKLYFFLGELFDDLGLAPQFPLTENMRSVEDRFLNILKLQKESEATDED